MKEKIGLVITTFNSESYFKSLYDTIPFDKLDDVVVVNGGESYKNLYDRENLHWIQHDSVKYPSVARNDGIKRLLEQDTSHFFVCEDDMLLKSPDVFEQYINANKKTGVEYFIYSSIAWEAGQKGNRTPKQIVEYSPELSLVFNHNMCNEFTYTSRNIIDKIGLYDESFNYTFDVDFCYRALRELKIPFWNFPDLRNSDDLVNNNSFATSRLDADGKRVTRLQPDYDYFLQKHGVSVSEIPQSSTEQLIETLKKLKK
jgi:glycosyltransferase involved in cell wall biosynthesis